MGSRKFPHFWVLTLTNGFHYFYVIVKNPPKMKKNTTLVDAIFQRIGLKKRKKSKEMRNYTILVDSFKRKVYSQ
jgi:hypothetical protein